jgi:hypothetical protein
VGARFHVSSSAHGMIEHPPKKLDKHRRWSFKLARTATGEKGGLYGIRRTIEMLKERLIDRINRQRGHITVCSDKIRQ